MFLILLVAAASGAAAGSVETSFGHIFGHSASTPDGQHCEEFLGIPFAEKAQRFMAASPWKNSYGPDGLQADKYAPWCPQIDGMSASGDEDCLFLNIWRPQQTSAGDGLSVMVWIYGGAFVSGDAGDSESPNTYNGCGLASRHDVIVANMNYRLGPLGFAAFENLSGHVDANWGFQDQREALRWLQREVVSFGGHNGKVTIFGESAGAQSVWHHLASSRSAGLFRAAISESGMPSAVSSAYRLNVTKSFASSAGCKQTDRALLRACLVNKSADELVMMAANLPGDPEKQWGPTVDGIELADYPDVLFRQNRTKVVPILAGINTNEGTSFIYPAYPKGMNVSQYRDFVTNTLTGGDRGLTPSDMVKVFTMYPPDSAADFRPLASALFTDMFLCRDLNAVDHISPKAHTFFYRFNHRPSCPQPSFAPGAYHGMELPFVFGTPETYGCSFSDEEWELSLRMQKMWTNFAKYLDPSIDAEPFPRYGRTIPMGVVLDAPSDAIDNGYRVNFCKFWADIWESQQHRLPLAYV